jgi:replicative DNA helicase
MTHSIPQTVTSLKTTSIEAAAVNAALEEGVAAVDTPPPKFEFDASFQSKIAALTMRDGKFVQRTDGLVKPEFFENQAEAGLVAIALDYYRTYKRVPADKNIYAQVLREAVIKKKLRKEDAPQLVSGLKRLWDTDVSDAAFVIDQVATFARHQAVVQAITESVGKLDLRDFDSIQQKINKAMSVGAAPETQVYDFKKEISTRTANRKEIAAGARPPQGITTGFAGIDKHLYHKGWGRRELSVLMGGAKAGKTGYMMEFGLAACSSASTCCTSRWRCRRRCLSARMDSNISTIPFGELNGHIIDVMDRVRDWSGKSGGEFRIMEYPSGSMRVSDLRRLLEHLKSRGIKPDLVIVDYADIMSPEKAHRERHRELQIDLRQPARPRHAGGHRDSHRDPDQPRGLQGSGGEGRARGGGLQQGAYRRRDPVAQRRRGGDQERGSAHLLRGVSQPGLGLHRAGQAGPQPDEIHCLDHGRRMMVWQDIPEGDR